MSHPGMCIQNIQLLEISRICLKKTLLSMTASTALSHCQLCAVKMTNVASAMEFHQKMKDPVCLLGDKEANAKCNMWTPHTQCDMPNNLMTQFIDPLSVV